MAHMNITLDMDAVQSTVQAKVRPAVEAALGKIDVQALIEQDWSFKLDVRVERETAEAEADD